ncbi:uncharacterized protein DS421_12g371610 [Arachis hypogaea]|nr:uncharacterized protein DS421_12g371610 [Arachis hypogaea]
MKINCSTCSPFMGTLSESNFLGTNQIMRLSKWGMVSKPNWQYIFFRELCCSGSDWRSTSRSIRI